MALSRPHASLAPAGLVALLAAGVSGARAAPEPAEAAFARFEAWARARLAAAATPAGVERGVALARQRRAALAELIRSHPRRALERALPAPLRERLPEPVQRQLEQPVAGLGELDVTVSDDLAAGRARYERTLTLDGRVYRAHLYGRRLGLSSRTIPVYGIAVGDDVAIHDSPVVPVSREELAGRAAPLEGCRGCVAARVGAELKVFPDLAALRELERELIRAEEALNPPPRAAPAPPSPGGVTD